MAVVVALLYAVRRRGRPRKLGTSNRPPSAVFICQISRRTP